jgi:DtxR family transcriptional regulator, Mn-dependent transcriptional regulator
MASSTEENYLKALLKLSGDNGQCTVSDLSQLLNISTPTANSMVKKIAEKKWITYEKYKPIHLTDLGRKMAALVIRKHRLTEMYLVEKMGFGWEEVHEIAEQIEHIKSEKFFDRMDDLLGHPSKDPHGSPIPNREGAIIEKSYERLSEAKNGKKYRLVSLDQSSADFLLFLNRRDVHLGIQIEVISVETFDGSIVAKYDNHPKETLSRTVCDRLLVEEI